VKSTEHSLEGKQCVEVADDADNLPPVRSTFQSNHAYKVALYLCY